MSDKKFLNYKKHSQGNALAKIFYLISQVYLYFQSF